jgi:DNA-binding transcriptional ArsR family regulator
MLNQSPALDRVFHALGDPTRRAMVEALAGGPASVSALAEALTQNRAISLPAVLQHLKLLEESGLVRSEKTGRVRICQLSPKALQSVEDWVAGRRAQWERRFDRLGAYLAEQDGPELPKKKRP